MEYFLNTVLLTTAVFAAFITSLANVVISLINNHKLKKLEDKKQMNEIDKYRYSMLYELVINWHKYDSKIEGTTVSEIAFYKLINLFMDDSGRYEIAKPLLDECYIRELENKKVYCEKLLEKLVENELLDGTHTSDFSFIKEQYIANGQEFSKMLKNAINSQLGALLRKNGT